MMRSLRARAIWWSIAMTVAAVAVGSGVLLTSLNALAERQFDEVLRGRHVLLVAALANGDRDEAEIAADIADPAYQRPGSGRFWQVTGPDASILASRSLYDAVLDVPAVVPTTLTFADIPGPEGPVRAAFQRVTLEDGTAWVVLVAEEVTALAAERSELRKRMFAAFSIVGILSLASAVLQTSAVLRPLTALRKDIASRWDSEERLEARDYPTEVAPLVADINTLLDRNRDITTHTRRQGADLAHALKTPSAILRNELESFAQNDTDTARASEALDRIDAQILRSLARMRAVNAAGDAHNQTNVQSSVARLTRLFAVITSEKGIAFERHIDPALNVAMDRQDFEEVLGNILENAFKWCRKSVVLTGSSENRDMILTLEDDGPGISQDRMAEALRPGGRLDTKSKGTGLGLAIAADLIQAYGGTLTLERSARFGGTCVRLTVPARPIMLRGRGDGVV